MSDDLVERVAFAVCVDAGTNHVCKIACIDCRKEARAAIAVVLEEAADAVGEVGDHAEVGAYINAIRAMIKETGLGEVQK